MRTTWWLGIIVCSIVATPARAGDANDVPDKQLIGPDDWFFLPYPENMFANNGQITLGKMLDEKSEVPGARLFRVEAESRNYSAKTFFKTRLAKPQELVLGRRVIYPHGEISSAKDKAEMTWGYGRIINLVDAPKGKLMVHGHTNPEVDLSRLRVIVGGERDPTIVMSGAEDVHHFHPEHWLVFSGDGVPDADGFEARMALAIRPPAKRGDEGVFLMLDSGAIRTTKYAYQSRPANRAELKTGSRIAKFGSGIDLPERDLAYRDAWWIGPLTEVTPSYIKVGSTSVRSELLRLVE